MRVLIIGGTAFLGRHIAQAAIASGHDVTVFHRGRTGAELPAGARHLLGDRDLDLSALSAGSWDATVDVIAYLPRQVRSLASVLAGRGGRHLLISSVSVYRTPVAPGFAENALLTAELADDGIANAEEVTEQTYGGLKVGCERAVTELYGAADTMIVRPTYLIGPWDYSGRFAWWLRRLAVGGTVLAPGDGADPIQLIDARDLAVWVVSLLERSASGILHAVSPAPPFSFGDMLEAIAAEVAPSGTTLEWVARDFLLQAGENDTSLPLWTGYDPERDVLAADPSAALTAGFAPRPLCRTISELRATAQAQACTSPPAGVGLSPEREAELLARWRALSARP